MNFVVLFFAILFTLFGIFTCAVLPTVSSEVESNVDSDVGQEQIGSSSTIVEKKLNDADDDHPGDHDKKQNSVARKGVVDIEADNGTSKALTEGSTHSKSSDRASTTITKDSDSLTSGTSAQSPSTTDKDQASSSRNASSSIASDKYSPSVSKSTETGTSHTSSSLSSKTSKSSEITSASTNSSKSSVSQSTESTSSKSSSFNKKPRITYSIEDYPALLNVPRVRQQIITPLTPLGQNEQAESPYLPPSSDFFPERMQSKRELYIFPLVVLIFLVPMVLGVGIIVLRRVRDYWSTRHYRRMDFLVDGMYNT